MTTLYGINGPNEVQWADHASYTSTINALAALGAKVTRQAIYYNNLNVSTVQPFYTLCVAADLQLFLVVAPLGPGSGGAGTYPETLSAQPGFANAVAAIAAACPGIWWEIGNECNSNSPGLASTYVPFFSTTVTALKAADSTCKVGPAPISNLNGGASGQIWYQALFTNGLAAVDYDFTPIHWYQYPSNLPPRVAFDAGGPPGGSGTTPWESYITTIQTVLAGWGNVKPVWLTETGWWEVTTGNSGDGYPDMTQALQSQYITEFIADVPSLNLPVVLFYALYDSGSEQFGWMNVTNYETSSQAYTPRPVYTAVAALWNNKTQGLFPFFTQSFNGIY
jgi:hypothetical protein